MWGETNPQATGGIKPLRGGGTLRTDGVGEVNRHNDRVWCFRRKANEPQGRRLVSPMAAGSRVERILTDVAKRDVATAPVYGSVTVAEPLGDVAAVHGLGFEQRCGAARRCRADFGRSCRHPVGCPSGRLTAAATALLGGRRESVLVARSKASAAELANRVSAREVVRKALGLEGRR